MTKSKSEKKQRGREAKQAKRQAEKRAKLASRLLWIGLPALFIVALVAWGVINQANQPAFDPLADLRPANIQGDAEAPITILEFGDFG